MALNDLDRFLALYESLGINLGRGDAADEIILYMGDEHYCDEYGVKGYKKDDEKFDGYIGFFSTVRFTKDGKFIKQGFWE